MDNSQFRPNISASTPLLSRLQVKLIQQIDEEVAYETMYETVVEMAEELCGQDYVSVDKIIKTFHENRRDMSLLLHSIPRPVLRSIVMRMVAYDFHDRGSTKRTWLYEKEGPGAYIVTLSIVGRKGCTWSASENLEIVLLLQQYALAIDLCEKFGEYPGTPPLTDEERSALELARKIDKAYAKPADQLVVDDRSGSFIVPDDDIDDPTDTDCTTDGDMENSEDDAPASVPALEMPKYASRGIRGRSIHVRRLAEMLERRHLHDLDPTEPCKQSVNMVGNAGDIERRTQAHRLITSNLRNSAATWGVLIYCLKYAGLEPEETIIPVCKTWELKQINMAEILVTVLAGSLISVDGLNVKEPGTRPEKHAPADNMFEHCRRQVWRANPWFLENLGQSFPDIEGLLEFEEEFGEEPPFDELEEDIQKLEDAAKETAEQRLRDAQAAIESAERSLFLDPHNEENDDELRRILALENLGRGQEHE
ncbi:hypothetical protein F4805DRAFT_121688 [Annulohypoxylon moriforme]|nr:hypothetical protein F4805DRAFT_121688 [Annulohypoxylon moriforme]